jgi:hypothetical protein
MVLIVGHNGPSSYTSTITGRTIESGGSVGGVNKAGIVVFGTTYSRGNMGNYLVRAPQTIPSLHFSLTHTTMRPTTGSRYRNMRSGGNG